MLKIAIVGLDTSHMVCFARLLNQDNGGNAAIDNARVTHAVAGGSPGFRLSTDRIETFTRQVHEECAVPLVQRIAELPADIDAVMIGSVDARQHLEQFRQIAPRGIPVFINKPLVASYADAQEIEALSRNHNAPVLSASGMRFTEALTNPLDAIGTREICGADLYSPMEIIDELPGYFWYGIHGVEMAYRIMGSGCLNISTQSTTLTDTLTAQWPGGRYVTLRGQRSGNNAFGGTIHLADGSHHFEVCASHKPYYISQLEAILAFFRTRTSPIPDGQTLEIMRFIEAANISRKNGQTMLL